MSSAPLGAIPSPDRWNLAAVLLASIFLLDWVAPANVYVPALYVLPTLLFVWAGRFQEPFVAAAIATVLIVIGLYRPHGVVIAADVLSRHNACEAGGTGPVLVRQRRDVGHVDVVVSDAGPAFRQMCANNSSSRSSLRSLAVPD